MMLMFHSLLLKLHIVLGVIALLLFWLPMLSRKGSSLHRSSGRYYGHIMKAVAFSGLVMTSMVWFDPVGIKGAALLVDGQISERKLAFFNMLNLFLFLLSLLTWVTIRHATGSLLCKQNREPLKHWSYQAPVWLLVIVAPYAAWQGFLFNMPLVMVFAGISLVTSFSILAYLHTKNVTANRWLIEHASAMIGSGIAAYTAFFAFGGRALFAELLTGHWMMLPWLIPSLIGLPATIWFKRRLSQPLRSSAS
ncbi:MAG TPA: hypothetical protein VJ795_04025 [Rheinheimera sp.]|uniref:hypothetical protein n=1 Tax=Rheinheimera sp. TaxID=1869214 RepID=UPI002B483937|nr:hypothetical protein [Rheinheimera sp.]HJS14217.1 hypothetical protein [Rheinheimera sp.]